MSISQETTGLECTACGSQAVSEILRIDGIPIHCNVPQPSQAAALKVEKGDMRLAFCEDCGHLYNLAFAPERVQYAPGYENALDFSPRFRKYAMALAQDLIDRYDLREKVIIEIACGRGHFLNLLCKLGDNHGIGFDPSRVSDLRDTHTDVEFIPDFYSERYGHHEANLICCRHALEHIQFPQTFLRTIRRAIGERTHSAIFFEVPNSLYTLKDLGIWDFIYEHCSYFCSRSLATAFAASGFEVTDVREEYEGQFVCIEAQPANDLHSSKLDTPIEDDGIADHVAAFKQRYEAKVRFWRQKLADIRLTGKRAAIWGAGSKGVTFLNVLKVQTHQVEFAVDINPAKEGLFVAGTGQKIVPPEFLKDYRPDYVIAMNPIYKNEIRQTLRGMELHSELVVA